MTYVITLPYEGKDEEFEIKETLNFGEVESLLERCTSIDENTGEPKISLAKYRLNLLLRTLVRAPFKINEPVINQKDYNVIKPIVQEVSKRFPLDNYLVDWMETYIGEVNLKETSMESTRSVPTHSGGTKKKSTGKK